MSHERQEISQEPECFPSPRWSLYQANRTTEAAQAVKGFSLLLIEAHEPRKTFLGKVWRKRSVGVDKGQRRNVITQKDIPNCCFLCSFVVEGGAGFHLQLEWLLTHPLVQENNLGWIFCDGLCRIFHLLHVKEQSFPFQYINTERAGSFQGRARYAVADDPGA